MQAGSASNSGGFWLAPRFCERERKKRVQFRALSTAAAAVEIELAQGETSAMCKRVQLPEGVHVSKTGGDYRAGLKRVGLIGVAGSQAVEN
jgi:hypothetical protein